MIIFFAFPFARFAACFAFIYLCFFFFLLLSRSNLSRCSRCGVRVCASVCVCAEMTRAKKEISLVNYAAKCENVCVLFGFKRKPSALNHSLMNSTHCRFLIKFAANGHVQRIRQTQNPQRQSSWNWSWLWSWSRSRSWSWTWSRGRRMSQSISAWINIR